MVFPVFGNYPGENYGWPANSEWPWNEEGVVDYPITLTTLAVVLNETVLHLRTARIDFPI
ncbi:MAG: hypothetical protein NTY19_48225 [Planctomycetota bacterium]|nr:hypothetical protein [Planctomycetota bacterium]